MFVAIKSRHSTYSGESEATVVSGSSIIRPGHSYFIMVNGRCIGVGMIHTLSQNGERTEIRFTVNSDMNRHVIEFAEKMFRLEQASNGGRPTPGTYADSSGTRHSTSTMDAATAIMTGRDIDVGRMAGGRQSGYGIADMMGLDEDDDDF